MKTICVIPARYSSTRLPGKPLREIAGKPMIVRVFERASTAEKIDFAIVATDDQRILDAVEKFHGKAILTRADHPTGTDRIAEVAEKIPDVDLIINVQGDEPLINPKLIDELAEQFEQDSELQMATVATKIVSIDEIKNPNNVKVVMDQKGNALYFSRSMIPFPRVENFSEVYKHIGIYAYRKNFLLEYAKMKPTPLEKTESLEQLRALENGFDIRVIKSTDRFIGVDTEEDLELVNRIWKESIE